MLGAAATTIGELARVYKKQLSWIAGAVIIIFGLHLAGILKIKALYADKRLHSVQGGKSPWGAFVIGFAFAFGWTPCLGPIISAILLLAGSAETVTKGVLLLWVYSLGLAVPFLITSLLIDRFLVFYGRFRKHLHTLEVGSGVVLIFLGALILMGRFTLLASHLAWLNKFSW
jgi:cytochrome c-type biogenesis protein